MCALFINYVRSAILALYTMPQFRLFILIDCETEILIRDKTNWETCLVTLQAAGAISRKKSCVDMKSTDSCFKICLTSIAALCFGLCLKSLNTNHKGLTLDQVNSYKKNGILVVNEQVFSQDKLDDITKTLLLVVKSLPEGTQVESAPQTIHAHLKNEKLLKIAREPNIVHMASQLLESKDVNIFTTRILCKMPKIGQKIPWHQDSLYWPLKPLKVVSFWLALDDVTIENGGMEMVNFTGMPKVRNWNLPVVQDQEDQGTNFFQHIPNNLIPKETIIHHSLKKGQASFHDAYIPHSSPPNLSANRRCAWIVRYIPHDTILVPSERNDFHNHQLIKAN